MRINSVSFFLSKLELWISAFFYADITAVDSFSLLLSLGGPKRCCSFKFRAIFIAQIVLLRRSWLKTDKFAHFSWELAGSGYQPKRHSCFVVALRTRPIIVLEAKLCNFSYLFDYSFVAEFFGFQLVSRIHYGFELLRPVLESPWHWANSSIESDYHRAPKKRDLFDSEREEYNFYSTSHACKTLLIHGLSDDSHAKSRGLVRGLEFGSLGTSFPEVQRRCSARGKGNFCAARH